MTKYRFFDPEYDDFLQHSGTIGMKWGVRNYQYTDGTWTELGKERRRIGKVPGQGRSTSEAKPNRRYSRKAEQAFISSIKSDVEVINKGHHPLAYGNCGYCSIAYEMRRRGFDTKAELGHSMKIAELQKVFGQKFKPFDINPYGTGYCAKTTHGIVKKKELNEIYGYNFTKNEISKMEKQLIAQGDGARGIIYNVWSDTNLSSAHYLNYEVSHGSVYQIDTQTKEVYRGLATNYLENSCYASVIRTDNAKINEKAFEDLFHKTPKKKADLAVAHSDIKGANMTVAKVVSLFRAEFADLIIGELRHIDGWYIFTIANAPKDKYGDIDAALDPYIGYNTQTNTWDAISPRTVGVGKFFAAKPIPFE